MEYSHLASLVRSGVPSLELALPISGLDQEAKSELPSPLGGGQGPIPILSSGKRHNQRPDGWSGECGTAQLVSRGQGVVVVKNQPEQRTGGTASRSTRASDRLPASRAAFKGGASSLAICMVVSWLRSETTNPKYSFDSNPAAFMPSR